jgi:hypothetical protein
MCIRYMNASHANWDIRTGIIKMSVHETVVVGEVQESHTANITRKSVVQYELSTASFTAASTPNSPPAKSSFTSPSL